MFKSKKRKNQVVEIAEQNENLTAETANQTEEIVKKCENVSTMTDSIIPDTAYALETSKQQWNSPGLDVILKRLKSECKQGNRNVRFYNSLISDELVKEFRSKGYRVEIHKLTNLAPYFDIYW